MRAREGDGVNGVNGRNERNGNNQRYVGKLGTCRWTSKERVVRHLGTCRQTKQSKRMMSWAVRMRRNMLSG